MTAHIAVKVTVETKVGDETYELGSADLESADDPNLPAVLRGIADEIERIQGRGVALKARVSDGTAEEAQRG